MILVKIYILQSTITENPTIPPELHVAHKLLPHDDALL